MNKLPVYFAPLQGYTEAPYRNAHTAVFGGVEAYYAPFVRIDRGEFRHKDVRDVEPDNNRVPRLIPQLIAPTAEKAEAIMPLFIERGYREVSINLGCPFPMLAKRHNGAGILPYPEEVRSLLAFTAKFPEISFSVKMRLGWEEADECLALAPILNELPLAHVTVHPRLGKQQYKGEVDREAFAAFYQACTKPLIYNGDLTTVEEIHRLTTRFPQLAGVMVGRGLLANPALAWEYKEEKSLSTGEMKEKLRSLHAAVFARYQEQLQGGDAQLVNKMKSFWEYLAPQIDRKAWKAIHKSTTLDKYNAAVRMAWN